MKSTSGGAGRENKRLGLVYWICFVPKIIFEGPQEATPDVRSKSAPAHTLLLLQSLSPLAPWGFTEINHH